MYFNIIILLNYHASLFFIITNKCTIISQVIVLPTAAFEIHLFLNLDWGPVPHFCPLETLQPVWLTPEVYCLIPRISNRSYSGRQVPLVVAPLAATGGTMGGNSGQIIPGICTQGSLTCRKSAT
jgi:hypothetical protein